jgi:hypothetical protein
MSVLQESCKEKGMIISNLESDEREGHGKGADESRLGIS